MDVWGKVDDAEVLGALRRLIALGNNPQPALRDIAALGESATRTRFREQVGPDGQRWKPSLRAQLAGGRTLTKDGHLSGSVSASAGRDFAQWGVNRIYAAIHQFGGVIEKAAHSRQVRHRTDAKGNLLRSDALQGNGLVFAKNRHKRVSVRWFFVPTHKIVMPARPYLGVNDGDRADILDVFTRHIGSVSGGAAHAG